MMSFSKTLEHTFREVIANDSNARRRVVLATIIPLPLETIHFLAPKWCAQFVEREIRCSVIQVHIPPQMIIELVNYFAKS
mmetsp:Transcript_11318/g.26657  ORF Transcript_11318/g.26657 Transcript_11318/m.26657 type:complete len:80 (+) Transcript_11318:76-315(+)